MTHKKHIPQSRGKGKRNRDNGLMDEQLYRFADAYYRASGRDRSFTKAALSAGVVEGSAHSTGAKWARYPQVQEYWRMLDKHAGLEKRSAHIRAIARQEDLIENETITPQERLAFNQELIKDTQRSDMFGVGEYERPDLVAQIETASMQQAIQEGVNDSPKETQRGHVNLSTESAQILDLVKYSLEYHFGED